MANPIDSTYNKIIVWLTHTSFICFTLGFCLGLYDYAHQEFSPLVLIDSIVVATLVLFYTILLLKRISLKNAMIILSYVVMTNVIASGFLFMDKPQFEANISYSVNIVLILLFVIPFTTSISQARLFNAVTFLFFTTLTFVSGDEFLWNRLVSTLLFLNGVGITCIVFCKFITNFIKSSIESTQKIEELSHYKQILTRLIIHDLKVPTSAILNLSNDPKHRSLREIHTQAQKINKQLEDVLDVERLQEPNIILDIHENEIDKLIERAILATENLALNKNMIVSTTFNALGTLKCDASLIERTLINLLTNAINYSPANESIFISVKSNKDNCHITIEDNGIGIPSEHLTKIFDKFYRIKSDNTSGKNSTGLGLSFCKLAIQAHKGRLSAISGKGYSKGSKFEIVLPNFTSNNSKVTYSKKYTRNICFTKEESAQIEAVCHLITDVPIYKASEIIHLTKHLTTSDSENIALWHEKITEAVYTGNQDYLNELTAPFIINKLENRFIK